MKLIKYLNISFIALTLLLMGGCEDAYNPYPDFETVPHSFGKFKAGTVTSLIYSNNNAGLSGDLQWISTDSKVKVVEIDLYITWSESYKDKDGLPKTAVHGKRKLKSTTDVGNAREPKEWSLTATEIYNLFKGVTFDYKDDAGARDVFANPKDTDRSPNSYFTSNDKFILSWGLKGDDGRYFDSWSQGICSETVGSNCSLSFGVICTSALAGRYTSTTTGTSTDPCCPDPVTVESEVEFKDLGSGKYEISDFSAGLYKAWYSIYGIDDAYMAETDKTKNKLRGDVLDACNKISGTWVEPFSESMTITGISIPSEGKIEYAWVNGYGDKATVVLTKK